MKGKLSNWDAIVYCENSNSGQEFKLQVKFPAKNTLTPMSRHSSTIRPIGIHKQAIKKNRQVEFEREAEEQKQR